VNLLFIAAEARELAPLVGRCAGAAPAALPVDWARAASLHGHRSLFVANGAGGVRAAAALEAACREFRPDVVVNTGFCGALDPELEIAQVVTGEEVVGDGGRWPARRPAGGPASRGGVVRSIGRVAQTAGDKRRLRQDGGDVVEMEAAGVAERAAAQGLPFYCIRAVTDLADESFAIDLNAALREDGHFDTMHILRESLRRPATRVPELLRLRNRCVRAARALGDFIAECRF
jgi:adenosylhomocysteine nucleosidase